MTSFLDTSVLVPVFLAEHPHHAASIALFSACEPATASCAAHSLAEVYQTLTRIPAPHRASPEQAIKCVEKIAARLRLVGLDGAATLAAIQNAAAQNIAGGTIYDSLIATCALRSEADRIYSWNIRHFERFEPDVVLRLSTPPSEQSETAEFIIVPADPLIKATLGDMFEIPQLKRGLILPEQDEQVLDQGNFTGIFCARPQNFAWFLGAGASASAGLPTATDILWDLKKQLYCRQENQEVTRQDMQNEAVRSRVQSYVESRGFPALWAFDEYTTCFDRLFGEDREQQRRYLRAKLSDDNANLTVGFRALGGMIAAQMCRAAFTTNFDGLVERAVAEVAGQPLTAFHLEGSRAARQALTYKKLPVTLVYSKAFAEIIQQNPNMVDSVYDFRNFM